jgi:single-stranded-DNA-specific exonuclease
MPAEPPWLIDPCSTADADAVAAELGLHRATAEALVRRGHTTPAAARAFLEQDGPTHDPMLLGDMAAACERIERAIAAKERICVHGDYDADGICATALAVAGLGELGANVEWHLPSRFEEGYGLAAETVDRLADAGVALLLTVDCGITAAAEVARAQARGVDVIVTDHHRPADELPGCPRVCTRPSDYAFPELCGTGVVYKLLAALHTRAGGDASPLEAHLDLVALATVADVVPLRDENRGLVRAGLRRLARTSKPGLRALMAAARVDRARVDSTDLGFRLAPRINAAGRMGHPGEALELLLTTDDRRARELAGRLEARNRERQGVEEGILHDAVGRIEASPSEWRARRAYVLASPDWHEGVIGIVASRLVERYARPVVLIAERDGEGRGSGRSIPAYDLHAGLSACAEHLDRFGGHRVAAGLSVDAARIGAFADALADHAAGELGETELTRRHRIDAVLAPAEASLELADELDRLEPFGLGNPAVTLLAPAASLRNVARMGEGRHLRMAVELGGYRCGAVWFAHGAALDRLADDDRHDVAYRLRRNDWNGAASAQMQIRAVAPATAVAPPRMSAARPLPCTPGVEDQRAGGLQVATIARLVAAGEPVAVLVADAPRRTSMLNGPLDPGRLGAGTLTLVEYRSADPDTLCAAVAHVVALDPPADELEGAILAELGSRLRVHLVWGPAEVAFTREVVEARAPLRPALVRVYRADRDGTTPLLEPAVVDRCRRVLAEAGVDPRAAATEGGGARFDLDRSATYREALARVECAAAFLAAQAG